MPPALKRKVRDTQRDRRYPEQKRQLIRRLVIVLGLCLLALTPALPLLARAGNDRCAWVCYTPAPSPASRERVVRSLTLWHLRPTLAVAMLLVVGIACVSLYASRRQLPAAGAVALAGGLVVVDALGASGVDWVSPSPHSLYSVRSSPLLIVPIVGVALTLRALLMSRSGPGAHGGERGEAKARR
jgi:hypothetical protein